MKLAYEPFAMDKAALRWFNASYTKHDGLYEALSFFLTTGWGPDCLNQFLAGVRPKQGWFEAGASRKRDDYDNGVSAMLHGYWLKRDFPKEPEMKEWA
jgi:hypothetical protein